MQGYIILEWHSSGVDKHDQKQENKREYIQMKAKDTRLVFH